MTADRRDCQAEGQTTDEGGGGHRGGHQHHEGPRPGVQAGIGNWRRSSLPFTGKLRLAFRNNLIKLRNRSSCCGHPGEPGC